ncbi:hypothetical protein BT96DRAFT_818902, partial [Gymnopus androsaceus JB14]
MPLHSWNEYKYWGFLQQPQEELGQINSKILQLKQELQALATRRSTIRSFIRSHNALLSPMRRLPAEVLSEIFFHCLPTDRNPVRSIKEAPLLFTRVCSRWRSIALESPRLW